MIGINWNELFPGRWSAVIFISYMALFVNQGILVTWSQRDGHYEYNIVTVVLMTEILKLIISAALYSKDNNVLSLIQEIRKNKNVLLLYIIPSLLYCIYNNLAFVNLSTFDPTTYYVLLQLRVVFTGITFQVVFNRKLSTLQWLSLILLTLGCMVKHFDINTFSIEFDKNSSILLIFVQTICSCVAGVYNEYLLKKQVIVILGISTNGFVDIFNHIKINTSIQPKVILIMINNALVGIITSFFLKNLNSILKTFASALELIFTAVLCWILFNIPINTNTVISIAMVSYAVILYSRNPVQNTQPKETESEQILV